MSACESQPVRCPIIYPGTPIEPVAGRWVRIHRERTCRLGGEVMGPDTIARWFEGEWECREHANAECPCDGDGTPGSPIYGDHTVSDHDRTGEIVTARARYEADVNPSLWRRAS